MFPYIWKFGVIYLTLTHTYIYIYIYTHTHRSTGVHYQECVSGIRVVSQPFCVDQLNPAGLILVRATLPIYLLAALRRWLNWHERQIGEFKNLFLKDFYKIVY